MRDNAIKYTTSEWWEWGKREKPLVNDYDTSRPRYMTEKEYLEWIMNVRHLDYTL